MLALASVVSSVVLAGWMLPAVGSRLWTDWWLMQSSTAACVLLLCCCGALMKRSDRRSKLIVRVCACLVIAVASLALLHQLTDFSTGVHAWLAADEFLANANRMSPQSATLLGLLAVCHLIDRTRKGRLGNVLDITISFVVFAVLVLISGYLFGADKFVGPSSIIRISPQTLFCVSLLTSFQVLRRARHGMYSVLAEDGIAGYSARVTLLATIVLSYLIVYLGVDLHLRADLDLRYASAVSASLLTILMVAIVVVTAQRVLLLEDALRKMSLTDELTGVFNRRGLYMHGQRALDDVRRNRRPMFILFCDVDGLKQVNDAHGHEIGSRLIAEVADLLRNCFRRSDIVGRVGGDEFAVMAFGTEDSMSAALTRLEAMRCAREQIRSEPYRLAFSVGGITVDVDGEQSLDALLERADGEMYRDKQAKAAARPDSERAGEAGQRCTCATCGRASDFVM